MSLGWSPLRPLYQDTHEPKILKCCPSSIRSSFDVLCFGVHCPLVPTVFFFSQQQSCARPRKIWLDIPMRHAFDYSKVIWSITEVHNPLCRGIWAYLWSMHSTTQNLPRHTHEACIGLCTSYQGIPARYTIGYTKVS
ncbi:uncharacterized protein K452DRAFT_286249 [Aplosporella prunicola CBS 121167]|uniref:Uncharacterized protein n=1 Tax=Aplosporella prunicola CBS 121167 TaxID=1176127 RepID=A0A6A6BIF7_9PEZI|nr:uncharacterized protein K452DRAFT_286249 [Aplosporella prunicola CBS 121167]KAF2143418.1 hypothetical protein K452DRAFT_286249 [Aplosporella prunicola CBS 121167]